MTLDSDGFQPPPDKNHASPAVGTFSSWIASHDCSNSPVYFEKRESSGGAGSDSLLCTKNRTGGQCWQVIQRLLNASIAGSAPASLVLFEIS